MKILKHIEQKHLFLKARSFAKDSISIDRSINNLGTRHRTESLVVILQVLRNTNYKYEISILMALAIPIA